MTSLLALVVAVGVSGCDKNAKEFHTPEDFDPSKNVSMSKAVEIAEARFPGSFAVSAELDPEKVGYEYEVIVYHEGKFWEVEIDTVDGRITEVEREDPSEGDIEMVEDDERDAANAETLDQGGPTGVEDQLGGPSN